MNKDYKVYIGDIREAIEIIEGYVTGRPKRFARLETCYRQNLERDAIG